MSDWLPRLAPDDGGPAYARIVGALAEDIERGALASGARLPTQRALAERLSLSVGTVTRAYAEAEARGLIDATVGRGSFVAGARASEAPAGPIELGSNISPIAPAQAALRRAMIQVARRPDLEERLDYPPPGGAEADRRAAATWLHRTANYASVDPGQLILTAGAQQAIDVAVATLCRPGDALVAEAATFHGIKLIAAQRGLKLVGAAMDGEGLTPAGLDQALEQSGARVAYVMPFQNPTARVMGLARRQAIVDVAHRRGAILIEDDLYGPHVADLGLPPLADLAPHRVAYVSGLSKCLAPGLRLGFLVPPGRRAEMLEALRAQTFGAPTLGGVIATHWVETGEAFEIWERVRAEVARRFQLAKRLMGERLEPLRQNASPHVWLPLAELEAERVASQALRAGVRMTPPTAPFVDGSPVSGLRICLGAARDAAELERGLGVVLEALSPGRGLAEAVV